MPFKKGDVVEVIAGKEHYAVARGVDYVIQRYDAKRWDHRGGAVALQGVADWLCADRFKLVEPVELVFAVGATVERTGVDTNLLEQGEQYIIETIYRDELGGVNKIKLQGINASYHVRGFKVVQNAPKVAFDPKEWEPQEGEKVFVVARDRWHTARMDKFINDGVEYTIGRSDGNKFTYQVRLDNGYVYDPRLSLRPVNAGHVNPAKKPAPPPKLELREALFKHQKQQGLGSALCSYAFETEDGEQHFYPYICHAMLKNHHPDILKVAYGFRHDMKRVEAPNTEEAHKAYSNYVISQSPWAPAFITQDINEAIEKDILMNVEVNRFVMAGACVALRTGQEYPDRPVIFKEMLDRGHSPHTCWLMSCAFSRLREGQYSFNSWTGGHDVIDKYRYLEDVIKFFQTGYHIEECKDTYGRRKGKVLSAEPFRINHGEYVIANAIARRVDDAENSKSIGYWFTSNTVASTVGEGWNKKSFIDVKALDDVATKLDKLIKG